MLTKITNKESKDQKIYKNSQNLSLTHRLMAVLLYATSVKGDSVLCPSGNFFDITTFACAQCASPCQDCIGTATNCLTCPGGTDLTQVVDSAGAKTNKCTCPQGSMWDGSACANCPANCATCDSTTNCLACLDGSSSASCTAPSATCTGEQYFDPTSSTCKDCSTDGSCASCYLKTGATEPTCTKCNTGLLVSTQTAQTCQAICPSGTFNVQESVNTLNIKPYCMKCPKGCEQCSSKGICQKCFKGYEFTLSRECSRIRPITSSTWCPRGTFHSGGACDSCPEGCSMCDSTSNCLNCFKGFLLENGVCKGATTSLTCPIGQFASSGTCQNCATNCISCRGSNEYDCKQCATGYHIRDFNTYGNCVEDSTVTMPNLPSEFTGTAPTPPTGCELGQFSPSAGQCSNCGESCAVCSSEAQCTTCRPGYISDPNNSGGCITDIPQEICGGGKYPAWVGNQPKCLRCPPNCQVCQGDGKCYKCVDDHQLDGNKEACFPFKGRFYPKVSQSILTKLGICRENNYFTTEYGDSRCSYCGINNCIDCSSRTSCERCRTGYNFNSETNQCVKDTSFDNLQLKARDGSTDNGACPLGKGYLDPTNTAGGCQECSSVARSDKCAKCTGDPTGAKESYEKCDSCYEGYFNLPLRYGSCKADPKATVCPKGMKLGENGLPECQRCGDGCEICGSSVCFKCFPGYTVFSKDSNEYFSCEKIPNTIQNMDELFDLVRQNSEEENYELIPPTPKTDNTCPKGFYFLDVSSKGHCVACGDLCKTCSDHTGCDSCIGGYKIKTGTSECEILTPSSEMSAYDAATTGVALDACGVGKYTPLGSTAGTNCETCPANCAVCKNQGEMSCEACYPGFELRESEVKWGSFKDVVGYKCTLEATNDFCGEGALYQRNSEGVGFCAPCPQDCKTCIDQNVCIDCDDGFDRQSVNGEGKQCDDKYSNSKNSLTYTLNAYQCPKSMYSSQYQNDFPRCRNCNTYYCEECEAIRPYSSSCVKCSQNSKLRYQFSDGRAQCLQSRSLDIEDFNKISGALFQCVSTECQQASAGLSNWAKFTENGEQKKCLPGCLKCESSDACLHCYDRFSPELDTNSVITACKYTSTDPAIDKICRERTYINFLPGQEAECLSCPDNCLKCTSKDTCGTCETGFTKNSDGVCLKTGTTEPTVRTCPPGSAFGYTYSYRNPTTQRDEYKQSSTYPTGDVTNIKKDCNICGMYNRYKRNCLKCSADNSDVCTECIQHSVLSPNGTCYGPEPTYPAGTSGPNFNGQLSICGVGFSVFSPNSTTNQPFCADCKAKGPNCEFDYDGHSINIECMDGFTAYNTGNGSIDCYPNQPDVYCPDGWTYDLDREGYQLTDIKGYCVSCGVGCKSCIDANKCIECFPGEECFLWDGKDTLCTQGKFYNKETSACQDCDSNCASCSETSTKCYSCPSGLAIDKSTGTCDCPLGKFKDGNTCSDCPYGCEKCNSATTCTTCLTGFKTGTGSAPCVGDCEFGKYMDEDNTCKTCNETCTDCTNSKNCTACASGRTLLISGECRLNCGPNQFVNNLTKACDSCPSKCDKCTTQRGCLSCNSGFNLFGRITPNNRYDKELSMCTDLTSCPATQTKMVNFTVENPTSLSQLTVKCLSCGEGCEKCDTPSECDACLTDNLLISGKCYGKCAEGHYRNTYWPYGCVTCVPNCAVCTNTTECVTCKTTFELNSEKKCILACQSNQYRDSAGACQNCPNNCATCSSDTVCLSCTGDLTVASDKLCHPACPAKQFRDMAADGTPCVNCPNKCTVCAGLDKCTECEEDSEILQDNLCYPNCTQHQFRTTLTGGGYGCDNCPTGCDECNGLSKCFNCTDGNTLISDLCYPVCTATQFRKTDNYCDDCPVGCSGCESKTKCSGCSDNFDMIGDLCYAKCETTQFRKSQTESYACDDCNAKCATCEDKTSCKTCPTGQSKATDNLCYESCPPAQFRDIADSATCKNCPDGCADCSSLTQCGDCKTDFTKIGELCYPVCTATQFRKTDNYCDDCPAGCSGCESKTKCSGCSDNFDMIGDLCYAQCQTTQFRKSQAESYACDDCDTKCATCDDKTSCKTCKTGESKASDGFCYESCPAAQFRDMANGATCTNCPGGCSACESLTKCSACSTEFTKIEDLCYPTCTTNQYRKTKAESYVCDGCESSCATCEDKTSCKSCPAGNEVVSTDGLCYPTCNSDQWRDLSITTPTKYPCTNCPNLCSKCTSATECSDCTGNNVLLSENNLCYAPCESNEYRGGSSDSYNCQTCPNGCTSCTGSNACTGCISGKEVVKGELCYDKCAFNEWRDESASGYPCKRCSPTECTSCKTGDTCDACVSTHDLVGNACLVKCEPGKWRKKITGESDCEDCSANCLACETDTGKCTSCEDGYTNENGVCVECPIQKGWYFLKGECNPCEISCKTCENEEKCKTCPDGEEVQPDGVCAEIVAPPTPPADSNEPKTCSAGSYLKMFLNECLDCEKTNTNGKCTKCLKWKYDDRDKCVGCNKRCKSCFGPGRKRCFKDSCTNSEYKTYKGFCTCTEGKFASKNNEACDKECHSSCGLCLGAGQNDCLTCKEDGAIPDRTANKQILGQKVGSCVNCAKNSADFPEICGEVTKEFEIEEDDSTTDSGLDELLGGSEDGEIEETALEPKAPERKAESEGFSAGFSGLEKHEEKLKDETVLKNLFAFIIAGYQEGVDFLIIIKFNFITKKIDIGIKCFKDMVNAQFTMSTRNFGSLQSDELSEDEETWDGEYRRRILQDETTGDDVILKEQSFSKSITARKVPTDGAINFAKSFGKISRIFMLILFIVGILLCLLKFFLPVNFDGHYLKLLMLIEFFTRSALIPANFGLLLSFFFDEMVKFDLGFMWKFINEGKFRGLLGGKLDEYRIPVLLLNSLPLATIVYFISFIVFYATKKLLKNKKLLRVISGIHFVVMAITILDVIFYGMLEIFHHNPVAKGNTVGSTASYVIALVNVIFAFIDIGHLFLSSMKASTNEFQEEGRQDSFEKFAFTGYKEEVVNKDKLVKVMNFGFIIRLVLAQILIANFQKSGKFIPWALFIFNIIYEILFFALVFMKKPFSSKFDLIQKIILETLIIVFSIMMLLFAGDPENKKYSSSTTEALQRITMFLILFAIISETALFAFRILTGFKNIKGEMTKLNAIDLIENPEKLAIRDERSDVLAKNSIIGQKKVKRLGSNQVGEPNTIKNLNQINLKPKLPVHGERNNLPISSMQRMKNEDEDQFDFS